MIKIKIKQNSIGYLAKDNSLKVVNVLGESKLTFKEAKKHVPEDDLVKIVFVNVSSIDGLVDIKNVVVE